MKKRHLPAAVSTAIWTYAGFGASLVSAPLVAHALTADGRGALAASLTPVTVLAWTAFLGLPRRSALQVTQENALTRASFAWFTLLGLLSTASLLALAPTIADGDSRVLFGTLLMAPTLVLSGYAQFGFECAQQRGSFLVWNVGRSASLLVPSILCIVFFIVGHLTFTSAVLASFTGTLFWLLLGVSLSFRYSRTPSIAHGIDWRFSLRFWFSSLFDSVGARADQFILIFAADTTQLGIYAVGVTCASASGAATQAMNHTVFADLVVAKDGVVYWKKAAFGGILSIVTGFSVFLIVFFFHRALFGDSFSGIVAVTGVLVFAQAWVDQWQLLVYRESALVRGGGIALASGSGFLFFLIIAASVGVFIGVTALNVAFCMLAFVIFRFAVGAWFTRSPSAAGRHRLPSTLHRSQV